MAKTQRFLVRFWGVRGSYPAPGPQTVRYGGNTTCVEVQVGTHIIVLDAGSGIIRLGRDLLRRAEGGALNISLFITHGHGDHLLGFPFFTPFFDPHTSISIFGPRLAGQSIEQLVTPLMSAPYFPVDLRTLPSHRTFYTLTDEEHIIWRDGEITPSVMTKHKDSADAEVRIICHSTECHPLNGALIYCIEHAGRRLVFATDVEWNGKPDEGFISLAKGADLLIHDAQYTTEDYKRTKAGYGHSTVKMATEVALAATVRRLILFHHEPTYDDNQLDLMQKDARTIFANTDSAYEGMEIDLIGT
jgi:phosphoribosyl 1,2-cyclic phosphodiesterase